MQERVQEKEMEKMAREDINASLRVTIDLTRPNDIPFN